MKKLTQWLTLGICGLSLGAGLARAEPAPVAHRQGRQQERIAHGIRSGALTRHEAFRLERRAGRIHRSIVRDRIDGGVFTPAERAKARHRLKHQSRAIYRNKHDRQQR